jgi:RNA polymerase sigma-70 factor (ECF subfamily)
MGTPALPERVVFERARLGDKEALTVVFRAYQPMLVRYLRGRLPDVAEDLAAQTWLDAVRNLGRFAMPIATRSRARSRMPGSS